jgi:hypothetical protein
VEIKEEHKKSSGFTITDEEGREKYYQFREMPYGLSSAVAVVMRLLQPLKAFCYKLGIRLSIYVDDGRSMARTEQGTVRHLYFVLQVMQLSGWNIQWSKTRGEASQRLLHLGFVTDTVKMEYIYPAEKARLVKGLIGQFIDWTRAGVAVPAKGWASLLGRLQSMRRSHGNVVNVMTRASQHMLEQAVEEAGWETKVVGTGECMRAGLLAEVPG